MPETMTLKIILTKTGAILSSAHKDVLRQLLESKAKRQERLKTEDEGNAEDKVAELAKSIHETHKDQDQQARLALECADMFKALMSHYWEPAFTAHPTNPADLESEQIVSQLRDLLYNDATITGQSISFKNDAKEEEFKQLLLRFSQQPVIAQKPLSVSEEIMRNNQIYKAALAQFADMKDYVTQSILRANSYTDRTSVTYKRAYIQVSNALAEAVAQSFNHMHFWSGTDADGNRHICPNTMEESLNVQRQTLLEFYQQQTQVTELEGRVENITEALKEYRDALTQTKLLSSENVADQQRKLIKAIQKDRRAFYQSKPINDIDLAIYSKLRNIEDLIKHVGLEGPALDVRQTTKELHPAMGYFIEQLKDIKGNKQVQSAIARLITFHEQIQDPTNNIGPKEAWQIILGPISPQKDGVISKDVETVLNAFSNNQIYLNALNSTYSKLCTQDNIALAKAPSPKDGKEPPEVAALREILRLEFLLQNSPKSRYRISDCKTADDISIVRSFEEIARSKLAGNKEKLSVIPLAETQQDIENLPNIVKGMLEAGLYANNELVLFPGYSDAEKRMGLAGLAVIQQAMFDSLEQIRLFNLNKILSQLSSNPTVQAFKNQYLNGTSSLTLEAMQKIDIHSEEYQALINNPEVQKFLTEHGVKTRISHGEGSDILRGGNMMSHHDSTLQGFAAAESLDPEHNAIALRHMMGIEDPYELRALDDIRRVNGSKELKATFNVFKDASVISHREMFAHFNESYTTAKGQELEIVGRGNSAAKALDQAGLGFIVDLSNKSSRAGSKSPFNVFNFEDGRAIGVALKLRSSNTGADLVGVASLEEIAQAMNIGSNKLGAAESMHQLALNSSVTQEIFYKTLWMGLNTDFNRPYLVSGLTRPSSAELIDFARAYDQAQDGTDIPTEHILAKMELQSFKAVEMALCSLAPEAKRQQILDIFQGAECGISANAGQRSLTQCIKEVEKIAGPAIPMLAAFIAESTEMEPVRSSITTTIERLYQCVDDLEANGSLITELMKEFNALPNHKDLPFDIDGASNLQKLNFVYSHVLKEGSALHAQRERISEEHINTITNGVDDLIYLFRTEQRMPESLLKFEAQILEGAEIAKQSFFQEKTRQAGMEEPSRSISATIRTLNAMRAQMEGTQENPFDIGEYLEEDPIKAAIKLAKQALKPGETMRAFY